MGFWDCKLLKQDERISHYCTISFGKLCTCDFLMFLFEERSIHIVFSLILVVRLVPDCLSDKHEIHMMDPLHYYMDISELNPIKIAFSAFWFYLWFGFLPNDFVYISGAWTPYFAHVFWIIFELKNFPRPFPRPIPRPFPRPCLSLKQKNLKFLKNAPKR